jgi:calcineurin-like phosphoesterase family protein
MSSPAEPEIAEAQPRSRLPWRRYRRTAVAAEILLVGVVGSWLGVLVGGHVEVPVGPVQTRMSIATAWHGDSVVEVPPLGKLTLDSHDGPLRLNALVTRVNTRDARAIFNDPASLNGLPDRVAVDVRSGLEKLVLRAVLSGIAGALVLGLLVFRRRPLRAVVAVGVSVAVVAGSGGIAAATWNPKSLDEPRYDGLLAIAPSMVGDARDIVTDFQKYEKQLAKIVTNVSRLYDVTSSLPAFTPDPSTIRVLSVSDLHINPAAWDVIRSITKQFDIDVIVDTGDISDHGTAAENAYLSTIATLGVPYVFVRGNHDSYVTQRGVAAQPNAVVLDNRVREVAGLRFAGIGDPRFTPDKNTRTGPAPLSVTQTGETLAELIRRQPAGNPVDVAMIHDPDGVIPLDGTVPLALSGHLHVRKEAWLPGGTFRFIQGSTGASGLRGLEKEKPTPIKCSVLYFDRVTRTLQAYDDITIGGLGLTSAQIERRLPPDKPTDAPATPSPSETPTTPTPSGTPTLTQVPAAMARPWRVGQGPW